MRYSTVLVIVLVSAMPASAHAQDPQSWASDSPELSDSAQFSGAPVYSLDEYEGPTIDCGAPPPEMPDESCWPLGFLGLRHSHTHGRHVGLGQPLVTTSWRNRPFYIGGDVGPLWMTQSVNDHVSRDTDLFGGIYGGWDWDHYWGTEIAVHRATPELINHTVPNADRGDRLMLYTASLMYYPWGDALYRPYARVGIGATELDFPTDAGHRRDETLWTFPLGVGIKYPLRRWLAARAEFADQLALGNHGVATQHNLTLTFGLECRFGAHPRSYWPWQPHRHIW